MGKFVLKPTKNGGMKFNLKATNGQVIASSQIYESESAARAGIASVVASAPAAALEDQTVEGFAAQNLPKFEAYSDKAGEYRFRLKDGSGQIIAVSEGYVKKESCLNGVESVRKNAVGAPIETEA